MPRSVIIFIIIDFLPEKWYNQPWNGLLTHLFDPR